MKKRALFLDRDGVLNELVFYESSNEWESPRNVRDLQFIDGTREPLQRLADAGWLLFIITNQPSFAKGKTTREELEAVQRAVDDALPMVMKSYVCFHRAEDRCECRKPGTKSLRDAAAEFDVDLEASWMVGDQDSDLNAGRNAGCQVAVIEHPRSAHKRGKVEADVRVGDVRELVELLLRER